MNYSLDFELEGLPKSWNTLTSKHWRVRSKESQIWFEKVHYATIGKRPRITLKEARLILTRYSSVAPDADNLVGSFKYVIDALVKCKILVDDNWGVIGMPQYTWIKVPKSEGKIRIQVSGVDNGESSKTV